jgi:hypothetical protein
MTAPVSGRFRSGRSLAKGFHAPRKVRPTMDNSGTDNSNPELVITLDTKVSDVLNEYGDIADVMETFGIKRVGGYSLRKYITERPPRSWRVRLCGFGRF